MDEDNEALRDRIYEASVLPEFWPSVCDFVSEAVGAYSMAVTTISVEQTLRTVTSPHIKDAMDNYIASGLASQNVRVERAAAGSPGTFVRDIDLMSLEEIQVDPIYTQLLHPMGVGWTGGASFVEPSGSILVFDVLRKREHGPFTTGDVDRMNRLKGDLARAAFMTTRLAYAQARAVTQALSDIALPAAVLGEFGDAIAMNTEFEALAPRIRTGFGNRISFKDFETNSLFQSILERRRQKTLPEVQSIPVAAGLDQKTLVVQLLPVRRNARDVFEKASMVMVVTEVGVSGPVDLRVISGLFDLTKAEARVAQQIAMGQSVDDAAKALGVSVETIRTHCKAVFRKTGTRRQSELAAMLSGLGYRKLQ